MAVISDGQLITQDDHLLAEIVRLEAEVDRLETELEAAYRRVDMLKYKLLKQSQAEESE